MTDPQALEKVPIKVVPIYFDEPLHTQPIEMPDVAPKRPRRKTPLIGALGVALAATAAVLQAVAIGVATGGDYLSSTVVAYLAIGFSVLAVGIGVLGIALNRGRRLGIAAVIVGIVANPLVLLLLLTGVGALTIR